MGKCQLSAMLCDLQLMNIFYLMIRGCHCDRPLNQADCGSRLFQKAAASGKRNNPVQCCVAKVHTHSRARI